ncbi:Uncharacterised protein [uncultured archaeon]|nr:Uncharacterised protein [uncultured archaeon]
MIIDDLKETFVVIAAAPSPLRTKIPTIIIGIIFFIIFISPYRILIHVTYIIVFYKKKGIITSYKNQETGFI